MLWNRPSHDLATTVAKHDDDLDRRVTAIQSPRAGYDAVFIENLAEILHALERIDAKMIWIVIAGVMTDSWRKRDRSVDSAGVGQGAGRRDTMRQEDCPGWWRFGAR